MRGGEQLRPQGLDLPDGLHVQVPEPVPVGLDLIAATPGPLRVRDPVHRGGKQSRGHHVGTWGGGLGPQVAPQAAERPVPAA